MPSKRGKSSSYDKEVILLDDEQPAEVESIDEESGEEGEIITLSDEKSDGELSGDDEVVVLDEPSSSNEKTTKKASLKQSVEKTKNIPMSDDDCESLIENSTEIVTTPQNITVNSKRKKLKAKRTIAADDKGVIEEYGNFVVDRVETSMTVEDVGEEEPGEISSAWRESLIKKILTPISHNAEATPKTSRKRPSIQCWNCDGDHNLNACPEKRDHKKISEARKSFQEMRQKAENPERYHSEHADATSESKFRPGRVSDALRNAMGLGRDDLPEYIYRMRTKGFVKGYPPGYLKQALKKDVDDDTLTFFVDDPVSLAATKVTPKPEKEAKPAIVEEKRIHYYMGFNNTYKFMKDRENNFRIPPFEIFVEMLQKEQDLLFKEMKRREVSGETRKGNGKRVKQSLNTDNDDMEVVTNDGEQHDGEECESDDARSIQSVDDMKDQSISDMFIIDKEPRVIPETPEGRPILEAEQESPKFQRGDSSSIISGTPVLQHCHSTSGNVKQSSSMPDLSAFAKGVTPFLRTEEVNEKKGLFKKIFSSIKEKFAAKKDNTNL